jgi:predicted dienelactone hydrolase
VGYQHLMMSDPAGPPVEVSVWYPTDAAPRAQPLGLFTAEVATDSRVTSGRHPLVVISHGNGGDDMSHIDTALALARAGYIAAALTHTGDNPHDHSRAIDVANRPRQLKLLVDYMLSDWGQHTAVDPARIGAFGFSAGGFTVLTAAGGEADLAKVLPYCQLHPAYYSCQLVARFPDATARIAAAHPVWTHDTRIRAVVAAAPALGFAFGKSGLVAVTQPIQLWRAAEDHILPQPDSAEAVDHDLPIPPDYRVVANADHYDFLAPCSDALAKVAAYICVSRPGFDRTAFHADFNRAVVAFFDATLRR